MLRPPLEHHRGQRRQRQTQRIRAAVTGRGVGEHAAGVATVDVPVFERMLLRTSVLVGDVAFQPVPKLKAAAGAEVAFDNDPVSDTEL